MRILFVFMVTLLLQGGIVAQNSLMTRGIEAMQRLDYPEAIELFQLAVDADNNTEAKIQLAECYRRINDTKNAELWYAQIVRLPQATPEHMLQYARMLQINGKCTEAQPWFRVYVKEKPDDVRGQNLAQACEQMEQLRRLGRAHYIVGKLPVNSPENDYAPVIRNNRLVFASERIESGAVQRVNAWNNASFARLYQAPFKERQDFPPKFEFDEPSRLADNAATKYHEATVTFAPGSDTAYLTCSNFEGGLGGRTEDGLVKLGLYRAVLNPGKGWSELQTLPFHNINYSFAHACLSADGQYLYFASTMPGGYGGMDLYVSAWETNRWGLPLNLGPNVNTEGNELFPYVDKNNRLYFASDGHVGLGGLDLFAASPTGMGEWSAPFNLGSPLNSPSDDFGIAFSNDLTWGFFCSNRPGGKGGDDLYGFQRLSATLEIIVVDEQTKRPLKEATVHFQSNNLQAVTGNAGRIQVDIAPDSCITVLISKKGYDPLRQTYCARGVKAGETITVKWALKREANYVLQGLVFDMTNGLPAKNARVTLRGKCPPAAGDTVLTGADGRFRFKLRRNCCYSVTATRDGFITAFAEGFCADHPSGQAAFQTSLNLQPFLPTEPGPGVYYNETTGVYEDEDGAPANANLSSGQVIRNGLLFDNGQLVMPGANTWARSDDGEGFLVNIYYDLDSISLRPESVRELDKLRILLRENSSQHVEIAAHTDSRGAADYNLTLSQRRAEAVVDWLVEHGVPRTRLIARGYGETRPVNRCRDGVECSEKEHQRNRRTEFKVLK